MTVAEERNTSDHDMPNNVTESREDVDASKEDYLATQDMLENIGNDGIGRNQEIELVSPSF